MNIFYGNNEIRKTVTDICLKELLYNDTIVIPHGEDIRSKYFSDPIVGTIKKVYVIINENFYEFDHTYIIKINIKDKKIYTRRVTNIDNDLSNIQQQLKIKYGSFNEELPEQKMAFRYLLGTEKILELGSNIGRNTLLMASIVGSDNILTIESDPNIANQLKENRDLNGFTFNIEDSALSKRKLMQSMWITKPGETLEPGYNWIKTITLQELYNKYNFNFDTLVLDCEGAFYYILNDMPEILNNVSMIITENDYTNISEYMYVKKTLIENGFIRDYVEPGGWGYNCPCADFFFEVWVKPF